jgi:hypothetical protein
MQERTEADIRKLRGVKEGFEGRLCPPPPLSGEEGVKCIVIKTLIRDL